MKIFILSFLICLTFTFSKAQNSAIDSSMTEEFIVKTKYGELLIKKSCLDNYGYYQAIPNRISTDIDLSEEFKARNLKKDTAEVLFQTNGSGLIISFKFLKKAKLDSFNKFIEEFCKEIILQSKIDNYKSKLNCKKGDQLGIIVPFTLQE
jgi:hypothetical protein